MTIFATVLFSVILAFIANSFILIEHYTESLFFIIPIFIALNIFAGYFTLKSKSKRLKFCHHGTVLLSSFYVSLIVSIVYQIILAIKFIPDDYKRFLWGLAFCIGINAIVFWNGIISVYLTSTQLGIKIRLIGIICGFIPIVNLIALFFIIRKTYNECVFESKKEQINSERHSEEICKTKYPILLVHGFFFRDSQFFNYWGRIPKELETNGATIFYGNHQAAATVEDCAAALKIRIEEILKETNAEKLNLIAHSKGGLDCRYAISELGIADRIASLTTINTPHHGCLFADYLLNNLPNHFKNKVANTYNKTLRKFGEQNPDFLAAASDLTDSACKALNEKLQMPTGIYCQSIGSVLTKATYGKFPLNVSYHLVKYFSGENDGMVSEKSFKWGENYILLRPSENRGISHGDVIDLNRENIKGFDVREFYVNLVNDLKNKGF